MNQLTIITQALFINYELISKARLEQRLVTLYYLFHIGKEYDKPHYSVFAFAKLKVILACEFRKIKSNQADYRTLRVGCSVIHFANLDFIDRDNLVGFIKPFDQVAVSLVERLKQNNLNSKLSEILILGEYFQERNHFDEKNPDINFQYFMTILIDFFSCLKTSPLIDFNIAKRSEIFFKSQLTTDNENEILRSRIYYLQNLSSMRPNEVLIRYNQYKQSLNLNKLIQYELCFPETINQILTSDCNFEVIIKYKTNEMFNALKLGKKSNLADKVNSLLHYMSNDFSVSHDTHRKFLLQNLETY